MNRGDQGLPPLVKECSYPCAFMFFLQARQHLVQYLRNFRYPERECAESTQALAGCVPLDLAHSGHCLYMVARVAATTVAERSGRMRIRAPEAAPVSSGPARDIVHRISRCADKAGQRSVMVSTTWA